MVKADSDEKLFIDCDPSDTNTGLVTGIFAIMDSRQTGGNLCCPSFRGCLLVLPSLYIVDLQECKKMKSFFKQEVIRLLTATLSLVLSVWYFLDGHPLSGWGWLVIALIWSVRIYLNYRKK